MSQTDESSYLTSITSYTPKSMMGSTTQYLVRLVARMSLLLFRDFLTYSYLIVSNATFQNVVIYIARQIIKGSLALTYYFIGLSASQSNPMVKHVEKEIKGVPTSKVMSSKTHDSTKALLKDSTEQMKLVSMSCLTVILTWIIRAATTLRRHLISLIAEHKKTQ